MLIINNDNDESQADRGVSPRSLVVIFSTIFTLWSSSYASAQSLGHKLNVCTVTLNSSDEKETFQKYLSPKDFSFVELVNDHKNSKGEQDWFTQACSSGTRCDVLIVSGHFAGTFFGQSGMSLPLSTLEEQSCSNTCSGILQAPREVFLFGCNTLASREKDQRTPEEYLRVLVDDGIPREMAERIVDSRYGSLGFDFKERIQRVFSKVPHIYGFSSIGPSGAHIKSFLSKYLRSKPDYAGYLGQDALARKSAKGAAQPNITLAEALKMTSFQQSFGANIDGKVDQMSANYCSINNENLNLVSRLNLINSLAEMGNILPYVPAIDSLFQRHPPNAFNNDETFVLQKIQSQQIAKTIALQVIDKLKLPILKFDLINLAYQLSWISQDDYSFRIKSAVRPLLANLNFEIYDILIHSVPYFNDIEFDDNDIPQQCYQSELGLAAIEYILRPKDYRVQLKLAHIIEEGKSDRSADDALWDLKPSDPRVIDVLLLSLSKDWNIAYHSSKVLTGILPSNPEATSKVALIARTGSPDGREMAMATLAEAKMATPNIVTLYQDGVNDPDEKVRVTSVMAIVDLLGNNDPRTKSAVLFSLSSKSQYVLHVTVDTIGRSKLTSQDYVGPLLNLVRDPVYAKDNEWQKRTIEVLRQLSPNDQVLGRELDCRESDQKNRGCL